MKCDQCSWSVMNGTHFLHERGCPNDGKRWNADEQIWECVYECPECGCTTTDEDEARMCCQPEEPKTREADMLLYLSDARGIYIPRDFARDTYRECIAGASDEDLAILEAGPDAEVNEGYWDTWTHVCDNATVTAKDSGKSYFLWQDGDLWLIESGAEYDEQNDQWVITE